MAGKAVSQEIEISPYEVILLRDMVELGKLTFFKFCRDILGYKLGAEHKEFCGFIDSKERMKAALVPRQFYKTAYCKAWSLWRWFKNDEQSVICVAGESEKAGLDFGRFCAKHWDKLCELFGKKQEFYEIADGAAVVKRENNLIFTEPVIRVFTGFEFSNRVCDKDEKIDIMIWDDVNDRNLLERYKVFKKNWLKDNRKMLIVGTPFYDEIKRDNEFVKFSL